MKNVIDCLLNILIVSIPEETVWVVFTLILLGRFDLLDWRRWKRNIKWLSIPILSMAIITDFFRYIMIVPTLISLIIPIILLISLITYIVRKTDKIKVTKFYWTLIFVILFTILGGFMIILTETIYVPMLLYLTNLSINDINNNILYNFIASLASRILQIIILIFIIYNKTFKIKLKNISIILKNKFCCISIIVSMFMTMVLWFIFQGIFANDNFVRNFSVLFKIVVGTCIILLPTIFLCLILINHIHYTQKLINIEKTYSNMLEENE